MKKILSVITICMLLCSCSLPEDDLESFFIYSYIFEKLSGQYKAGPSVERLWEWSGKPCYFVVAGDTYNYVSTLVDVGFGVTPWNEEMKIDQESAVDLLKFMIDNGCDLGEPHPFTGHTPAHSSAFFTRKNYELAKYVMKNSENILRKTPSSDPHFPDATALDIVKEIISMGENSEQRYELVRILEERTHNNQSQAGTASPPLL